MRCVSALKSLKALTLKRIIDDFRLFRGNLLSANICLSQPVGMSVHEQKFMLFTCTEAAQNDTAITLVSFLLFPYTAHFFRASYPLKKTALSCWTSWFQSSTSSCTHLAWSRCHHWVVESWDIGSVDGFTGSAGVPKITLGEFCFRCSHGLRCFHSGSFDVNLFGWIWVLWLITAPCFLAKMVLVSCWFLYVSLDNLMLIIWWILDLLNNARINMIFLPWLKTKIWCSIDASKVRNDVAFGHLFFWALRSVESSPQVQWHWRNPFPCGHQNIYIYNMKDQSSKYIHIFL